MISTHRVMFLVCAIVLLRLTSLSHSAPLACEALVRPLDQLDLHHLEGRWAMVAASLSDLSLMGRLASRDSATAKFSINTCDSNILLRRSMSLNNTCHYSAYNISLEGSRFTFDNGRVTTNFIHTSCQDCILMSFDVESGKRQHFYLFSRRRQLEQEEVADFRAQVKCLHMPPPVVMDPSKELCPEELVSNPGTQTEENREGKKD
ncbi:hypothetical protein EXN66_Car003212 [Channa argus]|uniref:Apolipoprotein M n=1 Tax=Channa argus TaxID=215402 RepID=A0A6G1PB64_CHAAH|nr:hypothetical protein EXN66_Car003212 [Channa argus]KAK2919086.1 hypothetical protein Q8A73_003457 [Channa argus]